MYDDCLHNSQAGFFLPWRERSERVNMTHWIDEQIGRQNDRFSLDQAFYKDPEIFQRDIDNIVLKQWLFVDHASRIPKKGDYFVQEIAGESIIILRETADTIRAFYNVCRHRGSRICLDQEGNAKRFFCSYHAWSYKLDGDLLAAPKMGAEFNKCDYGLHPCHVELLEGFIFINLSKETPPDFEKVRKTALPFLAPHQLEKTKIVAREVYPTKANWKLVLENFVECYHCPSSHPEYCSVNDSVKLFGEASKEAASDYMAYWEEWNEKTSAMGHVVGVVRVPGEETDATPQNIVALDNPRNKVSGAQDGQVIGAYRLPIKRGFQTTTKDGTPAAPLLGNLKDFDGGETVMSLSYLSTIMVANDYVTTIRFTPVSPQLTDVEIIWLAREDAIEGENLDTEKLKWMWHVTTVQDKTIVENNQLGVNSRLYQPGPYSNLEGDTNRFVRWYLKQIEGRSARRTRQTA